MKKTIKRFLSLMTISLVLAFIFMAVNKPVSGQALTDQEKVNQEVTQIILPEEAIIDFPLTQSSVYGSEILWESDNTAVISVMENGWAHVVRPTDANVTVKLTVTLTLNDATAKKEFNILVRKGNTYTNAYSITYVLNSVYATNANNNPTSYNVGETPIINDPTCGSLSFEGWYLNQQLTGGKVSKLPQGLSGNVTLYAAWAEDEVDSIRISKAPSKVEYNALEEFNKAGMEVIAHYLSGKEEIVTTYTVDKQVLHGNDTSVTVTFENKTATQNITVNKLNYNMSSVSFEDKVVTYNGSVQSIALTGTLPEGLTVEYSDGATNASATTYEITATFTLSTTAQIDYNLPEALKANLTINKANIDMSNVVFENKTVTYNGLVQTIVATNVPASVNASYTEGLKDVGSKQITLSFVANDQVNYNNPENMQATLTVEKAHLTITANPKSIKVGAAIPTFDVSYDGFVNNETSTVLTTQPQLSCEATIESPAGTYPIEVTGATATNYEIEFVNGTLSINSGEYTIEVTTADLTKTYNGQNQMFVAKLMDGENEISGISFTYEINEVLFAGATNAGTYNVLVSFNSPTYGSGSETFTFVINKATIDTTGVTLVDSSSVYDGEAHSLVYTGTLPTGITGVTYSENNTLTNVGSNSVTMNFVYDTANYNEVSALSATLAVTAKPLATDMFASVPAVSYTGNAITPVISGTYNEMTLVLGTDYEVAYSNNIEKGTATITVTGKNNYSGEITINFTIADSDLEIVTRTRQALLTSYTNDLATYESFPSTYEIDGQTVNLFWMSNSTALAFVNNSAVTIITDQEQVVTVTVLIIKNDSVEYASFTYTLGVEKADPNLNVIVSNVPENATLEVEEVEESEEATLEAKIQIVSENDSVIKAYNITLTDGESAIQPNGKAIVRLPIPTGYEASTLKVFYVGEEAENMNATVEGEYLVFETSHFSTYVITGEEASNGISISDFIDLEVGEDYYELTGIVTHIIQTGYGNFDLVDPNDPSIKIYVYGVRANKDAEKSSSQWGPLGVNEGDTITIMGQRAEHNGTAQVGDAYYVSHTAKVWTNAEKVAADKEALTLTSPKIADFTLPTTEAKGSNITWAVKSGTAITINGATATVTRPTDADATVVLTATITCGDASDTKEFSIIVTKAGETIRDLFISEYGEGSSNNKYIEIYNPTSTEIDLSGYSVKLFANGASTANNTHTFAEGTMIAAGGTYVLYNSSASAKVKETVDSSNSSTSTACNFNGDDAIGLYKGTELIDLIGVIGEDPGTAWSTDGKTTLDKTLIRNSTVSCGNATFTWGEWICNNKDDFTDISKHTGPSSN